MPTAAPKIPKWMFVIVGVLAVLLLIFCALFGFTTLVIHSFGDFGLHIPAITLLATVLSAHLCALGDTGRESPPDAAPGAAGEYRLRLGRLAPLLGAGTSVVLGLALCAVLAVPAQEIDRADVGRVLTPHHAEVVTKSAHARGDELLQLGLDTVLGEAGIVAERDVVIEQHLVQGDGEPFPARVRGDDGVRLLTNRARRAHPVERLVRLAVGVHGDRAVGLEQDQALRRREASAESAFVLDRASRHDQPHGPRCTTATTSWT